MSANAATQRFVCWECHPAMPANGAEAARATGAWQGPSPLARSRTRIGRHLDCKDSAPPGTDCGIPDEPPDAGPHVRWCGRGLSNPASYPIATLVSGQSRLRKYARTTPDYRLPRQFPTLQTVPKVCVTVRIGTTQPHPPDRDRICHPRCMGRSVAVLEMRDTVTKIPRQSKGSALHVLHRLEDDCLSLTGPGRHHCCCSWTRGLKQPWSGFEK